MNGILRNYGKWGGSVECWSTREMFPPVLLSANLLRTEWIYGITILAYIKCYRLPVPVSAAEMLYLRTQKRRYNAEVCLAWFRWPCCLKNRSDTTRVLGLRVRIPLWTVLLVCLFCVVRVAASASSWSRVQESYRVCGSVCDVETS
jgi:hypothetical protein